MLELVLAILISSTARPCNVLSFFVTELTFDNYQQYLKYTYNDAHENGRIVEIIEMVKTQPRNIPFDFEFNTVDGKEILNQSLAFSC